MSVRDEEMRERGYVDGSNSHIPPNSVTGEMIEDGAIAVGDIADLAVTAAKLAASVAGDGITGASGSALAVDVDDATLAIVANKVAIKDGGVTSSKIAAAAAGDGLTGGGGSALAVDVDGAGIEISAAKVALKDAGVTGAKLAAAIAGDGIDLSIGVLSVDTDGTGLEISATKVALKDGGTTLARLAADAILHTFTVPLKAFLANNTLYQALFAVPTGVVPTITKVELCARVIPIDADGTCTVRVQNSDADAGPADDEVVAAWDAESLVAKVGTTMTVITAGSVNVLAQHDFLFAELTNNSVAIDTPWEDACITIEYSEG